MTLVERIEALQAQKSDSVLVGAYLPFPLGPDVTVERLAVRIGAALEAQAKEKP